VCRFAASSLRGSAAKSRTTRSPAQKRALSNNLAARDCGKTVCHESAQRSRKIVVLDRRMDCNCESSDDGRDASISETLSTFGNIGREVAIITFCDFDLLHG
jgi:hypothetical protein